MSCHESSRLCTKRHKGQNRPAYWRYERADRGHITDSSLMVAALVIAACVAVALGTLIALRYLARTPDELADADVVRQLRPDGNATKIAGDE